MSHQPRKRFGQNFLQDHNMIEKIVRAIAPSSTDAMVEIGPGLGALTGMLLPQVEQLDAVEIDRDLIAELELNFRQYPSFHLHQADALKFDFCQLKKGKLLRIVGNLPYNISTPLLFHLFTQKDCIQDMYFMLQKEVVDRICAPVGTSEYSRLSVMSQYFCEVKKLFAVAPTCFFPVPKVESAIVKLVPRLEGPMAANVKAFETVVREAFNYRRKTLRNSLKGIVSVEAMEAIEISPNRRPQELSVAEFIQLSELT